MPTKQESTPNKNDSAITTTKSYLEKLENLSKTILLLDLKVRQLINSTANLNTSDFQEAKADLVKFYQDTGLHHNLPTEIQLSSQTLNKVLNEENDDSLVTLFTCIESIVRWHNEKVEQLKNIHTSLKTIASTRSIQFSDPYRDKVQKLDVLIQKMREKSTTSRLYSKTKQQLRSLCKENAIAYPQGFRQSLGIPSIQDVEKFQNETAPKLKQTFFIHGLETFIQDITPKIAYKKPAQTKTSSLKSDPVFSHRISAENPGEQRKKDPTKRPSSKRP